jgi:uncharacterized protein
MATLILKATEKCNSNCYYCDVVQKAGTGRVMPLELLETVFKRINEYLERLPNEELILLWHGGEPLLLGPDYYRAALKFQDKHCRGTKHRIRQHMQSNLTCMEEEYVPILKEMGINSIGTSYDPEPHMRGPGASRDTAEYNRRFLRATEILERNGIGWGLIYVITKRSLSKPMDVFHFLANLLLASGINMNPVLIYDEARKDVSVTPDEVVEFYGAIFPYWWQHRDRFPNVEPFKAYVADIIDGEKRFACVDSGLCSHAHMNVAPDGSASQCGRSSDWNLLDYGNIADRPLIEIFNDPQRDALKQRNTILPKVDCKGCRFWTICHGGCPLDSWSKHGEFGHKTEWCRIKKGFLTKYFEPITGVRYEPEKVQ